MLRVERRGSLERAESGGQILYFLVRQTLLEIGLGIFRHDRRRILEFQSRTGVILFFKVGAPPLHEPRLFVLWGCATGHDERCEDGSSGEEPAGLMPYLGVSHRNP